MFGEGLLQRYTRPYTRQKTVAPGKKKHPLLSPIALYFAHVKSAQLALEAALGALRDLLIFWSSVPLSPVVRRPLDTCYLWSARFGSRGGGYGFDKPVAGTTV